MGKKATLVPTKVSQKCILPMDSEYWYPVIFGNQKYQPAKMPNTAATDRT